MAVSSPSIAFQLTTSQGGRPKILYHSSSRMHFNSRPRKEVDGLRGKATGMVFSFQLTTSQGGRPRAAKHCCFCIYISTHDLTRRSTVTGRCLRLSASYFNSRPHKEVDSISPNRTEKTVRISTHDLTRRSTSCCIPSITVLIISTHDLTRRSTTVFADPPNCTLFQLTTSQGGRLLPYRLNPNALHFNSRPHKEVDQRLF